MAEARADARDDARRERREQLGTRARDQYELAHLQLNARYEHAHNSTAEEMSVHVLTSIAHSLEALVAIELRRDHL